jgi:hypothetical protein
LKENIGANLGRGEGETAARERNKSTSRGGLAKRR